MENFTKIFTKPEGIFYPLDTFILVWGNFTIYYKFMSNFLNTTFLMQRYSREFLAETVNPLSKEQIAVI